MANMMRNDDSKRRRIELSTDGSVKFDVNVANNTTVDPGPPHGRLAKFQDTRQTPLIKDTNDYTIGLVRGAIKTNNFPLFQALPSSLITENGVQMWECTMQPGLALTWTGPVFQTNGTTIDTTTLDHNYVTWPNIGQLPYYTTVSTLNITTRTKRGFVNLQSGSGASLNTQRVIAASRLTNAFTALAMGTGNTGPTLSFTFNSPVSALSNNQFLSITNSDLNVGVYLDFTMPSSTAQFNANSGSYPSKAGILQVCKFFGFIPNTLFYIAPNTTAVAPRAYQLGFRSTMNLYCYKTARWVPEDVAVTMPSAADVKSGTFVQGVSSTYFDAYSYQHVLNNVVNPAIQRCIYDEFDSSIPTADQCLLRQLNYACKMNVSTNTLWSSTTSYTVGQAAVSNGHCYVAITANTGNPPFNNPNNWLDCGESITCSWSPAISYILDDFVSIPASTGTATFYVYQCAVANTNIKPPNDGSNSTYWTLPTIGGPFSFDSGAGFQQMNAEIGTLAPTISFNSATQLFTLNLDSYGSGGTLATNVYDGYGGFQDDPLYPQLSLVQQAQNATLNDQARDSWGLTGVPSNLIGKTAAYTVARGNGRTFDEKIVLECDDYFHQLFGNWPSQRLTFTDPNNGNITTSYVRYIPQAVNGGLSVPVPLPLQTPTVVSSGYLPYGRVAGNQPYIYNFPQDYPSVGNMWNPVDTIVLVTTKIPVVDDQITPPYILTNTPQASTQTANSYKILAEFVVRPGGYAGQEYRNEIIFDPQTVVRMNMTSGIPFFDFDVQAFWRKSGSQVLYPVTLSNNGSMNLRFEFLLRRR
jgi:hypothetical protein